MGIKLGIKVWTCKQMSVLYDVGDIAHTVGEAEII